jgi:glucokinase
MIILAADIGGTNARFAAFETDETGSPMMIESVWLETGAAESLMDLLDQLPGAGFHVDISNAKAAVLAAPGPVQDGSRVRMANVSWELDITPMRKRFPELKSFLINDFVAQAYGCHTRAVDSAEIIQPGKTEYPAVMAVIGAGTGLGHCAVAPDNKGGLVALPSEAGHAAFPFFGDQETDYLNFLLAETGKPYAYGDLVVSGRGLALVHQFLTNENLTPAETADRIDETSETTAWFSRFYARACRNYALTVLPLAGLFVSGGVASQNPHLVQNEYFKKEFVDSPNYLDLLKRIPIRLNMNQQTGLYGAALYGAMALNSG